MASMASGQTAAVDQPPELLGVIQDTIAPDSWDGRGGRGVIRYWRPGHALVVHQSGNLHQALADLISALH